MKVIASERIEPLVADLAHLLVESPLDPMTAEWIAVGSEGLQRWLQLQLARHLGAQDGRIDGVTANIGFHFPGSLRTAVTLAGAAKPEFDPWLSNRLIWSVWETLQSAPGNDPLLAPLMDASRRTIYRRVRLIAARFAEYQLHRPKMLLTWAAGSNVDAAGSPLTQTHLWQPHLWRMVRRHIGSPSPAERLFNSLEKVRSGAVDLTMADRVLPPRLIFFGPSLLPSGAGFLEVAEAAAAQRDVIVYVIEPSIALSSVVRSAEFHRDASSDVAKSIHASAATHPLLRSWGRLQSETALLLGEYPLGVVETPLSEAPTLLRRIQNDIRSNIAPDASFELKPSDHSIRVHSCFGPTRQVEALRDTILGLLNDPELRLTEDEIIVASPTLDTFAPIIRSVFGASATDRATRAPDGTPLLRYQITGLAGTVENPVTSALQNVLRIAGGRFDVTDVVELLAAPAIRERFGWTESHLATLHDWIEDTNVRWGLDPEHRSHFGFPSELRSFTWQSALDQLLLGTAIRATDEFCIGDTLAVDSASSDPSLVGELAGVLSVLADLSAQVESARTVADWAVVLADVVHNLLAPDPDAEWQLESTIRELTRLVDSSRLSRPDGEFDDSGRPAPSTAMVEFTELRQMLDDALSAAKGRSDFFRGGVTITSLNALRNIPARVICILGADQSAFAARGADSDDLVGASSRVGDRDRRAEVRQTVLDAVLSAEDALLFFVNGYNVRTNVVEPYAVVVSELLDAIEATCQTPNADEAVVIRQPRQPFSPSLFDGSPALPGSFSRSGLAGALARRERSSEQTGICWPDVVLHNPVHPVGDTIHLDSIKAALKSPIKTFLTQGLGIRLNEDDRTLSNALPIDIENLEQWKLGTALVELLIAGDPIDGWEKRQSALGAIPPLGVQEAKVKDIRTQAGGIIELAEESGGVGERQSVPIDLRLPSGRRLVGEVTGVDPGTRRVVTLSFSRHKKVQELFAWVDLMALTAMDDTEEWQATIISKRASKSQVTKKNPIDAIGRRLRTNATSETALDALNVLADFCEAATSRPIPFDADFSSALNDDNSDAAARAWRNLADPAPYGEVGPDPTSFVYPGFSFNEVSAIGGDGHPLVDDGEPVARRYAALVWKPFNETISLGGLEDEQS